MANDKIRVKTNTHTFWSNANPKLEDRELLVSIFPNNVRKLYQGDGATRYNGLTPIAGGNGVASFAELSDADTVDLAEVNPLLAEALESKLPNEAGAVGLTNLAPVPTKTYMGRSSSGTGGVETVSAATLAADLAPSLGPETLAHSTTIRLDNPLGIDYGRHVLAGAETYTVASAPAPTLNGAALVEVQLGAGAIFSFGAGISVQGDEVTVEDGRIYEIAFLKRPSGVLAVVTKTAFVSDTTKPVIGTPHAEQSARNVIVLPITELNSPALNGTTADVTLTNAGGRIVAGVAVVGNNLNVTLSSPLNWNDTTVTVAIGAGMVRDFTGNLSDAKSATTVVNNLTMPVPGQPTSLTSGSPTSTSVPISFVAPVVDATHGTPVTYQPQVRTSAGPGAWSNYGSAVTHPTVSANPGGLTPSTSYDFQVIAHNGTGDGAPSATLSGVSTPAASAGALSVAILTPGDQNLTAAGNTDWRFYNTAADGSADDFKLAGGFLAAGLSFSNASRAGGGSFNYNLNWTDGTNYVGSVTRDAAMSMLVTSPGTEGYAEFTPPADTTTRKWRIGIGVYVGGATPTNPVQVSFHLSDGSAADQSVFAAIDSGGYAYAVTIIEATFRAASSGQTLRVRVRNLNGLVSDFDVRIAAVMLGT